MTSTKYIGLDVHKETISIAVMNSAGKLIMESVIETKAITILQFIQGLRGDLHVTFEEGTWAAWLYDLLKPHVTKVVVCNPRKTALLKDGSKSDRIDARKLAELLRNGALSVYHGENGLRTLKELSRSYLTISKDLGRVMNRIKALYRSWAIPCAGTQVYAPHYRSEWLGKITKPACAGGQNFLPTTRRAAGCAPGSAAGTVGREPETQCDETATPDSLYRSAAGGSIGCVDADAPQIPHQAATVDLQRAGVGDTRQRAIPRRRRTAATFQETRQLRGLNTNHNHDLKNIFKGTATRASTAAGPFRDFYETLLAKGMRPSMARLTLARKIAAITLIVWKKGGPFRRQTSENKQLERLRQRVRSILGSSLAVAVGFLRRSVRGRVSTGDVRPPCC